MMLGHFEIRKKSMNFFYGKDNYSTDRMMQPHNHRDLVLLQSFPFKIQNAIHPGAKLCYVVQTPQVTCSREFDRVFRRGERAWNPPQSNLIFNPWGWLKGKRETKLSTNRLIRWHRNAEHRAKFLYFPMSVMMPEEGLVYLYNSHLGSSFCLSE